MAKDVVQVEVHPKTGGGIPKLSVVVPAYNEKATIAETLSRVQAVNIDKEIIVIDDGSTDGTREPAS